MQRRATRGETEFAGGGGSNTRLFAIICAFVVCGVLIAWLLAPEKPEAPAASNIVYELPPETDYDPEPDTTNWAPIRGPRTTFDDVAEDAEFVIRGRVVSIESGEPVANTRVNASRVLDEEEQAAALALKDAGDTKGYIDALEASKATGRVTTGDDGRFVIPLEKPGRYNLSAIHSAYLDTHVNGVMLVEGEPLEDLLLELSTGASVQGKVYETDSRLGVPGIAIAAQGPTVKRIKSGADGTYSLGGLKPGDYEISLSLRGTPYQVRGRVPVERITIQYPDEVLGQVDFGVAAAGTVWGYVKDYEGRPIDKMNVMLVSPKSIITQAIDAAVKKAPPINARADEEGYYELQGVPLNTEWRVHAISDELAPQLSDAFLLTERERSVRVDLFIIDGSTVTGRVVDSKTGAGVVDAQVVCIPVYSRFFAPVDKPQAYREDKTKENGSFVLPNIPEGDYQIMAYADGYKVITQGTRIDPDGIKDISGVAVKLTPIGGGNHTVYGVVRDTQGKPIPDANLSLATVSTFGTSAANFDTTSDNSGRFVFEGVDSGFLILNAGAQGYASRAVQQVRVDEETLVTLEAMSGISGRVTVKESGQPPGSGTVNAIPVLSGDTGGFLALMAAAERSSAGIQPDGSYQLNLPSGRYTLEARATGFTPGNITIEVVEGVNETGVDLQVSRRGGSIQGRVRTADNTNPSGAVIQIHDAGAQAANAFSLLGGQQNSNVVIGADATFEFENLPPGPYTVTGELEGFAQARSPLIVLEENENEHGVELTFTQGGSVQGYVLEEGEILVGAVVTAVSGNVNQSTTSDGNGQYRIDRLPPGEYLLSAVSLENPSIRRLFAPRHATVTVEEGAVTTYNFGDETGTRIEGYLTPPPPEGQLGFAILTLPGGADQVLSLNMTNPIGWFTGNLGGAGGAGGLVMGMGAVESDGAFVIENAPPGAHELVVVYANMGSILSQMTEVAAQQIIEVVPGEPMQLQIQVAP